MEKLKFAVFVSCEKVLWLARVGGGVGARWDGRPGRFSAVSGFGEWSWLSDGARYSWIAVKDGIGAMRELLWRCLRYDGGGGDRA